MQAQNLVPNFSFDTYSACPDSYGPSGLTLTPPWVAPTWGTPDYFNVCAPDPDFGVPSNYVGYQPALLGDGYMGLICWGGGSNFREYLQAPLIQPLLADTWYQVSFYLNQSNIGCGTNKFGAYFSVLPPSSNSFFFLNLDPQVEANQGIIKDTVNWVLVTGCFQAEGGEAYITLGSFYADAQTLSDPDCPVDAISYFLIENVSVVETTAPAEIIFDLGGPETVCYSYEIDPGLSGYNFLWEDGSTNPTLVVTESGTYSLTITEGGCDFGIDSIEVTIIDAMDPIDIGPPQVTLCEGDSYEINLDPGLGDFEWQDGSDDADYIITTPGTYTVTLDDGCSVSSDQIEVIGFAPPEPFSLGDDQNLCEGDQLQFMFDPLLGDFIWQDNSTSSTFTVTDGGTYALTISNMCGEESDEIEIMTLAIPEVEIGPSNQQMCMGDVIDIGLDPDLGDILWQDGSTASDYAISSPGTYTVMVSNECGTGSDVMNVTLLEPPAIYLGADTTLCEGDTVVLSAPGAIGDYVWQDDSENETFTVTTPGAYTLHVSNFCGDGFDLINIGYNANVAPPALGPDLTLCSVQQLVLYANSSNANYVWQDGSTADSLLVTASGTYYVQASNTCSSASDTVTISFNGNPPHVDLPAQLSLCQGQSVTLDAAVTGVSYLWNNNSQNQQLVVNAPGTYSVTVTNACGTDVDTTIIADGGPAPFVALGGDVQLCAGDVILISPGSLNVNSWMWQDGSTGPTYAITDAGTISVLVSNSCGSDTDTLHASLLPPVPPLDLGVDTALCSDQSLTLSINIPGVLIVWPDGSTDPDYTVSDAGPVYAAIANSCGTSYDTIIVTPLPDVPILHLGNDQSLCPGETITLNPGIADVSYTWQDGSTGITYQSTQEETIILTISNTCGTSTDTLEVIENLLGPQLDLGPDIQVCAGETVTIPSGISGVNYVWQDGSINPEFTTSQSGTIILNVSNNCGTDTDTIVVDISGVPPTVVLVGDTTLCEGTTLTLTSDAGTGTHIEWQDGSSTPTFIVSSAGMYSLSESNRCGDASDSVSVAYVDAPDPFLLRADTTLCPGETIILTAPTTAFDIHWQDGSNQPTMIADKAQTYSLQVSNDCGSVSDDFILSYDHRVPQLNLDPTIKWCKGDVITLDATQSFAADYLWNTGATTPSLQITNPGVYSVDVSTLCSTTSQAVDVIPSTDCDIIEIHTEIHIPNVFSPNGDGINDVFGISFGPDIQVTAMQGTIFDRWGNMVFDSKSVPFVWDGFFKNERVMPGVYVYRIECKYIATGIQREEIFTGDVTVIR